MPLPLRPWRRTGLRRGLLCCKSRGKLKAVWAASPHLSWWCVIHVVKRRGGRVETTVVLDLDVPRGGLRLHRSGLWYCPRDVSRNLIRHVLAFGELAAVPAA
jgi:hypothetical protein